MDHAQASLISTIAVSLACAVVLGFIAMKLRLPAIIGSIALNAVAFRVTDYLKRSIKPSAADVVLSQPFSVSA